jgi:tetratricopeptide (TPR) repeat protein
MAGALVLSMLSLLAGDAVVPTSAAAQRGVSQAEQREAVELYRRGREHFEAGRYREAIADLEQALARDPSSPTLVYNVARVYELLGELDQAIRYYQVFLRMLGPDEDDERTRVADTIARLQGARDQVGTTDPVAPPDNPQIDRPVIVEERGVADVAFWATVVTAGALLAGGGVFGALALTMDGNADCVVGDQCTLIERDDYGAMANNFALTADILFVAGGVAAVAATLLYALRTRQVETYPQYQGTTAYIGTDGRSAVVGVEGRF